MISQKTIENIFDSAKIEEVVGDFVQLKKRGVNMLGLCPFHNEKTPSFTVSPAKNIYKCFGCSRGGNPVNFIMEHENLSYPEALRYLAGKYNIHIDELHVKAESDEERQLIDSLYIINKFAQKHFEHQLFETDEGKSVGMAYFKGRGFREETIKKFGLGFAPNSKDSLVSEAKKAGYKEEYLRKLGLTNQYGGDFFRKRVVFTIHNLSGKVIGFGARILDKKAKMAKYLNSPESEIYNKSKVIYGAYFAKRAIRQEDRCFLVEGYTDVISLHQSGIENVVSSSGTSLTIEQIRLIKRNTSNITMLYDGDAAGIKAAIRGVDLVLEQDMNVKVVLLPDGEDPDSYLQKVGVTKFKEFIDSQSKDFMLFKTGLLLEEAQNDPIKKASLIKEIVQSISKIPDPIKRSVYIKECASLMEIQEQVLVKETNKITFKNHDKRDYSQQGRQGQESPEDEYYRQQAEAQTQKVSQLTDDSQEQYILRLLIEFGDKEMEKGLTVGQFIKNNMEDLVDEFDNKKYAEMVKLCFSLIKSGKLSQQYFTRHSDPKVTAAAINLINSPYVYSENWEKMKELPLQTQPSFEENFKKDTVNTINFIKFKKVVKVSKINEARIKEAQKEGKDVTHLIKVQMKLIEMRRSLTNLNRTFGAINYKD